MTGGISSIMPSVAILGFAAVIAMYLTASRVWADDDSIRMRDAVRIAAAAVLCQAGHFTEELLTGFHYRFTELFGLAPMSLGFFVSFNVTWLLIWSVSCWGLALRHRAALFPLWFLGIASVLNGMAHPGLAILARGYFPGLATSPIVGVLGILLLRRLGTVTITSIFS